MTPVLLAFALAATPAAAADSPAARFNACVHQSDADPVAAIAAARAWAGKGGGVPAGQCLGIAQAAAGQWPAAAATFAATADLADTLHDAQAADLWVSAGNAALAAGDAKAARASLDKALASTSLGDPMRGEAYLDRARADVALSELPAARTDMDQALKLVPGDPVGWLLSATLARRAGDLPRATADIREAAQRAPNQAEILFEQGNIAAAGGRLDEARVSWARARAADPGSDAGKAAEHELAQSGGVVPAPPAPPVPGR